MAIQEIKFRSRYRTESDYTVWIDRVEHRVRLRDDGTYRVAPIDGDVTPEPQAAEIVEVVRGWLAERDAAARKFMEEKGW